MKQRLGRTGAEHKPVRAVVWLPLIAVLTGVSGWLFTGVFTPVFALQDPDYLFIPSPVSQLVLWCLASFSLLCAVHAVCATRVFKLPSSRDGWDLTYVSVFSPLLLL